MHIFRVFVKYDIVNQIRRQKEARLLLMIKLFETGRLSLGQAAKTAGYSKQAFMEILGKYGVPVFDSPPGELEREASRELLH